MADPAGLQVALSSGEWARAVAASADAAYIAGAPIGVQDLPLGASGPQEAPREAGPSRRQRARAQAAPPRQLGDGGDTEGVVVADADGLVVSLTQSLGGLFGSGMVDPALGFALHARGHAFQLGRGESTERGAPRSASQYGVGRRPTHTLSPYMLARGGEPFLAVAMKGGDRSPYAFSQFLLALFETRATEGWGGGVGEAALQKAIDAPRFRDLAPEWPKPWQPYGTPSEEPLAPHSIDFDELPALRVSELLKARGYAPNSLGVETKFADSAFAIIHALMWLPPRNDDVLEWAVATDGRRKPGMALTIAPQGAAAPLDSASAPVSGLSSGIGEVYGADSVDLKVLAASTISATSQPPRNGRTDAAAALNVTVVMQWHTGRMPVAKNDPYNPWTRGSDAWAGAGLRPLDFWRKGSAPDGPPASRYSPEMRAASVRHIASTLSALAEASPTSTMLVFEHGAWDNARNPVGNLRALTPPQILEPHGFPLGRLPVASPSRTISALSENRLAQVVWMGRHGLGRNAPRTVDGARFVRSLCGEAARPSSAAASMEPAVQASTCVEHGAHGRPNLPWQPPSAERLAALELPAYPLFFKQDSSMYGGGTHLVSSAADADGWSRMRTAVRKATNGGTAAAFVAQEAIVGPTEVTVNFVALYGQLLDSTCFRFSHARALYVKGANDATNRLAGSDGKQPCNLSAEPPATQALLKQLLERSVYTGIGCVQFKEVAARPSPPSDATGGPASVPIRGGERDPPLVPVVIDINPRICGSLGYSKVDTVRFLRAWWEAALP